MTAIQKLIKQFQRLGRQGTTTGLIEFLGDLERDGSREVFLDDKDLTMLKEIKQKLERLDILENKLQALVDGKELLDAISYDAYLDEKGDIRRTPRPKDKP